MMNGCSNDTTPTNTPTDFVGAKKIMNNRVKPFITSGEAATKITHVVMRICMYLPTVKLHCTIRNNTCTIKLNI